MENMRLYVYNSAYNLIGPITGTTSIQWLEKYNEQGQFAIHVFPTKTNMDSLVEGNYIVNVESNTIGFIEYVLLKNEDSVAYDLEVKGHLDNLYDRINLRTANITNVQKDLLALIEANKRGLNIVTRSHPELVAKIETTETTWKPLNETISEICHKCGYGYRMIRDGKQFNIFELYEGKESGAIFSESIGNAVIKDYLTDISEYKNFAYVCGEGEGANRKVVKVDKTFGGPIRELYVDAKDLTRTWIDEKNIEHTYSEQEYEKVLMNRGLEKLAESKLKKDFKFEIMLDNKSFIYGVDYKIGDIVTVKSEMYGISKKFRLIEVKNVQEKERKRIGTLEEVYNDTAMLSVE